MVTRSRRKLHIAQLPQRAADCRVIHRHLELVVEPSDQIDQPPANDPVDRHIRAAIHDRCQGLALHVIKLGLVPRSLPIEQSIRTAHVEADNPVANNLQTNGAKPRRGTPAASVINLCQRQQAPALVRVLRNASQLSQPRRVKIAPKCNPGPHNNVSLKHATIDSHFCPLGNPLASQDHRDLVLAEVRAKLPTWLATEVSALVENV
jgi:hypothetical protein